MVEKSTTPKKLTIETLEPGDRVVRLMIGSTEQGSYFKREVLLEIQSELSDFPAFHQQSCSTAKYNL